MSLFQVTFLPFPFTPFSPWRVAVLRPAELRGGVGSHSGTRDHSVYSAAVIIVSYHLMLVNRRQMVSNYFLKTCSEIISIFKILIYYGFFSLIRPRSSMRRIYSLWARTRERQNKGTLKYKTGQAFKWIRWHQKAEEALSRDAGDHRVWLWSAWFVDSNPHIGIMVREKVSPRLSLLGLL